MTRKSKGTETTVFRCRAPEAQTVFLAGSFNQWNAGATPMAKDAEGNWSVAVDLKPGRYEFKFVVDGAWCCEPGHDTPHHDCTNCVPNPFGTVNHVVEVA
jgi:1,4-alpha-glucan branching enzyme